MRGTVTRIDSRGHGAILADDGREYGFRRSEFGGTELHEGDRVAFVAGKNLAALQVQRPGETLH